MRYLLSLRPATPWVSLNLVKPIKRIGAECRMGFSTTAGSRGCASFGWATWLASLLLARCSRNSCRAHIAFRTFVSIKNESRLEIGYYKQKYQAESPYSVSRCKQKKKSVQWPKLIQSGGDFWNMTIWILKCGRMLGRSDSRLLGDHVLTLDPEVVIRKVEVDQCVAWETSVVSVPWVISFLEECEDTDWEKLLRGGGSWIKSSPRSPGGSEGSHMIRAWVWDVSGLKLNLREVWNLLWYAHVRCKCRPSQNVLSPRFHCSVSNHCRTALRVQSVGSGILSGFKTEWVDSKKLSGFAVNPLTLSDSIFWNFDSVVICCRGFLLSIIRDWIRNHLNFHEIMISAVSGFGREPTLSQAGCLDCELWSRFCLFQLDFLVKAVLIQCNKKPCKILEWINLWNQFFESTQVDWVIRLNRFVIVSVFRSVFTCFLRPKNIDFIVRKILIS